jgi:hydrogenase expression/formation protein HypC
MCLAIPGQIIDITGEDLNRIGKVSFAGVIKQVNLAYVPEAKLHDYVIVHVGFALSILDEEEATKTLTYLQEMEFV